MSYLKTAKCLLVSSAISLVFSLGPVNAEDANQQTQIDELGSRVSGIETKLDDLHDLLQKQAITAPAAEVAVKGPSDRVPMVIDASRFLVAR